MPSCHKSSIISSSSQASVILGNSFIFASLLIITGATEPVAEAPVKPDAISLFFDNFV